MDRITDCQGDEWVIHVTEASRPERAFWVFRIGAARGVSRALPGIAGFYAASIDEACTRLGVPKGE